MRSLHFGLGERLVLLGLCLAILPFFSGCSGTSSAGAEATGVITLDGQPLANAFITFVPKGGGSSAFATADSEGKFSVQSSASTTGLAPGDYVVVVEQGEGSAESSEGEGTGKGEVSGSSSIPDKYRTDATSDLTVTVAEGEQKSIQLDLTSAE